jgi:predicted AlkP superfamily phosphohydrolase/phosphomutase/tetratricopeptide (TPR) repeat protein
MQKKEDTKVLLVGWDAADWQIIKPLLDAGRMPNLKSLMLNGASGTIETMDPPLSPMLWTSIATGKTPEQHGILGFIEPDPVSSEPRPASVTSRNCKALWNILSQNGLKSNVVGWWPSHPAEPIKGNYVSNMFCKPDEGNELIPETVFPEQKADSLRALRVYPSQTSIQQLLRFVPRAEQVNQDKDKHLHNLAALVANCISTFNVAESLIRNEDWNLSAVYFDTIDQCSHTFMKFFPPAMDGVPEEYYRLYNNVVSEMYVFHDELLGKLLEAAGDNANVILLSDHGFYSGNQRPVRLPNDPASPALEHSRFGILCASGPLIKKTEIKAARLLDICPTVLTLLGVAAGTDMPGRILSELLSVEPLKRIGSWENIEGQSGMHSPEKRENSWHSTAAMFQMMELGYIENIAADKAGALKKTVDESDFYLSVSLMSFGRYEDARSILTRIWQPDSSVFRYGMKLAACEQLLGNNSHALEVLNVLRKKNQREFICPEVISAICISNDGNHEDALKIFKHQLTTIRHLPRLFLMAGNEHANLQEWSDAEHMYLNALELDPQYVKALSNLSEVLRKQNKDESEFRMRLERLSINVQADFKNTVDEIHNLDFNPDQKIDFRKYQLIIRLFLEQFHKGVKKISN